MSDENTQNFSGRSGYLDQTPNSHNKFTRKCVAARGKNQQSDLES